MLPTPIIIALSVARLDVGHRLGVDRQIPIGAAILTAELRGPLIHFTLGSCVLQPSDPADWLLTWLDDQLLRDGATIAGYGLDNDAALLDHLPGAKWSPCIRALAGCGQQYALNLTASHDDKRLGRVRQRGVISGAPPGRIAQAVLGVICRGGTSSICGVARAVMPSICM